MEPAGFDFANHSGRGVTVGLIDSGIRVEELPLRHRIQDGLTIGVTRCGEPVYADGMEDLSGHGTAVAKLLLERAPEVSLVVVRLLDRHLQANGYALLTAMEWAVEQGCRLINLSLGTARPELRASFARMVQWALDRGCFVVAAAPPGWSASLPAVVPQVFAVTAGQVSGRYGYAWRPDEKVAFICDGAAPPGGRWQETAAVSQAVPVSSFAAPRLTGVLALLLEAHPEADRAAMMRLLQQNSCPVEAAVSVASFQGGSTPTRCKRSSCPTGPSGAFRRAALFPAGEATAALQDHADLLGFELVGVAEWPSSDAAQVRIRLEEVSNALASCLEGADSLIIGDLTDTSRILQQDLVRFVANQALAAGFRVFSPQPLDGLHQHQDSESRLYSPLISPRRYADLQRRFASELAQGRTAVERPVVGVFSLRPSQRCFGVQLVLGAELMRQGYSVGQLGTDPYAELFDSDCCFPFWAPEAVQLPATDHLQFLRLAMLDMDRCGREIIVVSDGSGLLPGADVNGSGNAVLGALTIVLGTCPDAFFLVADHREPPSRIRDAARTVETLAGGRLTGLIVDPRVVELVPGRWFDRSVSRALTEDELAAAVADLERGCGVPVVEVTSQAGRARLCRLVVELFAAPGEPIVDG